MLEEAMPIEYQGNLEAHGEALLDHLSQNAMVAFIPLIDDTCHFIATVTRDNRKVTKGSPR